MCVLLDAQTLPYYFIACISSSGLKSYSVQRMKLHINKTPLTNNGAPGLRSILDTQHCFNLSRWSERNSQETGKVLEKVKKKKTFPQKRDFFWGLFGADLTHKFDLYPSLKRR